MFRSSLLSSLCLLTTLGSITLGLGACNYNDVKNIPRAGGGNGVLSGSPSSSVDYATVRAQIFEPQCLKCHSSATPGGPKKGVNLETYAGAFAAAASTRSQVETDQMPDRAPPLAPELKTLLFAWIDSGAPEKTVVSPPSTGTAPTQPPVEPPAQPPVQPPVQPPPPIPPPVPPPTTGAPPDFAKVQSMVFEPHCYKCHSSTTPGGPKKGIDFEKYAIAFKFGQETVDSLINDDMPRRAPALPEDLKKIVFDWFDAGMPETVP